MSSVFLAVLRAFLELIYNIMAGPRPNQAASAAQSQVPANSANSAATTDLQTDISSDIASVCDSWEASALASSLEHVVENVGLHFLGGGKEYPARELASISKATN